MSLDLKQLAHELNTQDNLATGNPIFLVQQKKRIYGIDLQYDPKTAYSWVDDPEYTWDTREEALKEVIESGHSEDDFDDLIEEVGYIEQWDYVCAHLTMKAAKEYIERYGYNLNSPRVYVHSQYRCDEFNEVVEYLKKQE